ncbi:sigma-70 family RNA polymerase sigma factor [Streptomyces sp. HNM0663]|uniref:Sigma-70 family RNA polymerase sigma factor n=1 Tax=Streptomyces chengmaiensis TaxID=3040919 RepID=A0ABT6HFB7_9ACTN|nr:sigma-70 family RNA polymerase sigma factor [Streptomyces chengmaiensis]MDH2387261.1 sigma-70 family RNA polymerase sigma factor [Streptomyces chengmaiensis]
MTGQIEADEVTASGLTFDAFFARTFPGMTARALLLCGGCGQDAEDAVQEAYTAAFVRWDRLRHYDAPDAWVYRVVRQRLWAAARDRARTRPAEPDTLRPPAAAAVEQTVEARAVLSAVAALPAKQRTVLVLNCLEGMTQEAIAEELGITRGGVAAHVSRARDKLAKALGLRGQRTAGGARRARHEDGDALVPAHTFAAAARPVEPADPVTALLRRTELWLRAAAAQSERPAAMLAAVRRAAAAREAHGAGEVHGAREAHGTGEVHGAREADGLREADGA